MKRMRSKIASLAMILGALCAAIQFTLLTARAQNSASSDPSAALVALLTAACRANETQFANYLTADSASAFRALPEDERAALLKRLSLTDDPGQPLLSSDPQNRPVLRCQAQKGTVEYRFGGVRAHENLAFIPVTVVNSEQTEFGLVRENGGWRLLSLGLVLLDIPQLSRQWGEQDLLKREDDAVETLRALAQAVQTYRSAWGKLPETLAQLGPAPKDQISPDQADLVNEDIAAGAQEGYSYRYRILPSANGSNSSFELAAAPQEYGKTGRRSFFLDSAGKVHGADKRGAVATPQDPLISGEKSE